MTTRLPPMVVGEPEEPNYVDIGFWWMTEQGQDPGPVPVAELEELGRRIHAGDAPVTKRLSPAFGSRQRRRAQLVARLKQSRRYDKPVRGGTGKQSRSRRRSF